MPPRRRPRYWPPLRRRLGAGVVLATYLLTSAGVPLPALPDKDRSQPFPCQEHACGCHSAEQCWRHCCCFTPEEKWAWARAHGVEPPAYAERPAAVAGSAPACPHCGHGGGEKSRPGPGRWLLGMRALACHGLSTVWVSTGAVVLPPPPEWGPRLRPADCLSYPDSKVLTLSFSPPDPPPRHLPV